jgi:hypothetical protein
MTPVREIPMSELTDTELDAVCGGILNFGNIVTQTNTAVQVGVGIGGLGGLTSVAQFLGQANFSL